MTSAVDLLARLAGLEATLVVHIGADQATMADYADLSIGELVLVQGDAATGESMIESLSTLLPKAQVLVSAVAATAGTIAWHRYNLPLLNGPCRWEGLSQIYPRLQLVESFQRPAVSLLDTLSRLVANSPCQHRVLVMDLPEQAQLLVDSLSIDVLKQFEWLLLAGQKSPNEAPGGGAARLHPLTAAGFEGPLLAGVSGRLWPLHAFRLNRDSVQRKLAETDLARWRDRCEKLERELAASTNKLMEAHGQTEALRHSLEVSDSSQERLRQAALVHAEEERAVQEQLVAAGQALEAHQAQIARLSAQLDEAQSMTSKAQAKSEQTEAALLEAKSRMAAERERLIADQQAALGTIRADLMAVKQHARAQESLLNDAQAALGASTAQSTKLQSALESRDADLVRLQKQLTSAEQIVVGLQAELASSREKQAAAAERLAESDRKAAESVSAMRLTMQLQMVRENDLKDLQSRYGQLRSQAHSQQDLLRRLAERLTSAQRYFEQVSAMVAEPVGGAPAARVAVGQPRATPSRRRKRGDT